MIFGFCVTGHLQQERNNLFFPKISKCTYNLIDAICGTSFWLWQAELSNHLKVLLSILTTLSSEWLLFLHAKSFGYDVGCQPHS